MVLPALARLGRHLATLARPRGTVDIPIGCQRFDAAIIAHHRLLEQVTAWTRGSVQHFSSHDSGDEGKPGDIVDEQYQKRVDDLTRRRELLERVTLGPNQLYSRATEGETEVGIDNSDLSGLADILSPDFEPRKTAASSKSDENSELETAEEDFERELRSSPPQEALPANFFDDEYELSDDDLDGLIVQRNFEGIEGLPPLDELRRQDDDAEARAERRKMEMEKQEAVQLTRVRQVDRFGRAYATGRRKTSSARVWLAEGEGRILVNGATHDIYFPQFTHRTHVLQPFLTTNTLGLFDIKCTVAGGGMTGTASSMDFGAPQCACMLFEFIRDG